MAQINSNEEQVTSLWQDIEHAKSYQENGDTDNCKEVNAANNLNEHESAFFPSSASR